MELSMNRIKAMSDADIYESLKSPLDDIYKTYKSLISVDEFQKKVLEIIKLSKKVYNDDIPYDEFIIGTIKKTISKIIKTDMQNPKKSYKLINSFINNIVSYDFTVDKALEVFKELDKLFKEYSFIPDLDFLIKLLVKNEGLNNITTIIFKYYKYQVISGSIQEIFTNETIIATLNAYCLINNIEINDDEEILSFDLKSPIALYLDEIAKYPVLTPEQERELAILVSEGNEKARKKFIEHNLKLVVNVAKRYRHDDFTLLDLIQEGNVGLIKAVDKFDVEKGYKFSSYAIWWIRHSINRAIENKGKNVRVPVNMYEKLSLYNKVYDNLNNKLGRAPTIEELANAMGLPKSKIIELNKIYEEALSLNNPVGESKTSEFSGSIPASQDLLEDTIIDSLLPGDVHELIKKCNLTPRELGAIKMRFGFDDDKIATLDEIGQKYHVTRERARQILAKGLRKLRYSRYTKAYAIYMQYPDEALANIDELRQKYAEDLNTTKGFLPTKEKDEKRKKLETKLTKSIYEYFSDFTTEQIEEMLSKLNNDEIALLNKKYGNDLLNPIITELTKEEEKILYGTLIPKMRVILNSLFKERKEENVMLQGTTIINRKKHSNSNQSDSNEKVLTLKRNK